MYCRKCGSQVEPGAYCSNCGEKAAESKENLDSQQNNFSNGAIADNPVEVAVPTGMNIPQNGAVEQPKKPKKSKGPLIAILSVVFVLVIVVAGVLVLSATNSPDKLVEKFATNLQEQKWESVYDNMFVGENEYVTLERFKETYSKDPAAIGVDLSDVTSFRIAKLDETEKGINYKIVCNNDEVLEVSLDIVKDGPLSFDEYRITVPSFVSYTVQVPENTKVKFEGKTVPNNVEGAISCYEIYPLIPGEYELDVEDSASNKYGTYVTVSADSSINTLTLTADEIKQGKEKKAANEYTTEDAEAFFNKIIKEHSSDSINFFFLDSENAFNEMGFEWFDNGIATFDSKTTYTSEIESAKIKVSDIMTKEEFDKLDFNSNGCYKVYKVAEIQKKLDELWVPGRFSAEKLAKTGDVITSKGYLVYGFDGGSGSYCVHYGAPAKCVKDGDTKFVLDAYMIYYDVTDGGVYDFTTNSYLASAQIDTEDESVNFNSIKDVLGLDVEKITKVTFTFEATNMGVRLVSAKKNGNTPQQQQPGVQPSVSREISYCSSYYMTVKAGGGLNMRLLPSTTAGVVTLIPNAGTVTVLGYSPTISGWSYVNYGSCYGWVNNSYLVAYGSYTYSSGGYGGFNFYKVVANGGLNMRASASSNGRVITVIPNGATIQVDEIDNNGWASVYYNGSFGWVRYEYLSYSHTEY